MICKLYFLVQTVPGLEIMAPRAAELRRGRKEKKSGLASRTMATAANSETYSTTTVHRTLTSGSHFRTKHSQLYTVTRQTFQPAQPKKGQFLTFEGLAKAIRTHAKWTSGLFYRSYRAWPTTMYSLQRTICPTRTQKLWKRLKKRPDGSP